MAIQGIPFARTWMAAGLLALSAAAQVYMPPTSLPPAADYDPQGEYFGTVEGTGAKLGAWLVSRSGSKFDVSILPGGLLDLKKEISGGLVADPNGGWDGKTRFTATNITLSGTTFAATISGGGATYTLTSITGTGPDRVLNGTVGGAAFALTRKTRQYGIGGDRQSPTLGLRPEGKSWSTGFQSWFVDGNNPATTAAQAQADLTKWKNRENGVQLKYGNFLYRGIQTVASHGTMFLHIEVRSPFVPTATGQNRGNSGIYLRGMHEQQVLDSFGGTGTNDELGAVYKVKAPLVNAALPPLTWQVYDIYYTAGAGITGTFTTYLNGVKVQEGTPVSVVTEAGSEGTTLYLQAHGNEVIYNNIWMIPNATPTSLPYKSLVTVPDGISPKAVGRINPGTPASFFDAAGRSMRGETRKLPVLLLQR
jgi:hypothetical protein